MAVSDNLKTSAIQGFMVLLCSGNIIYSTQNSDIMFVCLLCCLTLSESAPSSLLADF